MSDAADAGSAPAQIPRKKNHAWIWFFVFVLVASASAAWLMISYNLGLQLTSENLHEAQKLWKQKQPSDYNMEYTKHLNQDSHTDKFSVKVRGGQVTEVLFNGKPLPPEQRPYHSMDRVFHDISRFMDLDSKSDKARPFVRADFDKKVGYVRSYVRSVRATSERVEMHFKVEAVTHEPVGS